MKRTIVLVLVCMMLIGATSIVTADEVTLPSPESFLHMQQVLSQYPKRARPGVDLLWHTDRAMDYQINMIDRKNWGMPYMYERVYHGPVKIRHDTHWGWDCPHAVGRLLLSMMAWEELTGKRVDQKDVDQLKWLIHQTIGSDNRAHYYNPATGRGGIDIHSHRETLLSLLRLARVRKDEESLELVRRLVQGIATEAKSPNHNSDPTYSLRMTRALLEYHRFTGDPLGLEVAKQFADETYQGLFDDTGKFAPGHTHSVLGALIGAIEYGLYTNQAKYVERMKKVLDIGIWKGVRSTFGTVFETAGRPLGEGNETSDVVTAEILLGLNGYPEYFDDVERILRNHHLGTQHLDPTVTVGRTAEELGLVDNDIEIYTDAPRRVLGGYTFQEANEMFHIINDTGDPKSNGEFDMPTDTPSSMIEGNIDAWNAIVTSDEAGLRVNLLFSKETHGIDIRSFIPVEGRVELDIRKPVDVYVRIPGYVDLKDLTVTVNGADLPKSMFGPYLLIPKQPDNKAQVVLQFPQPWKVTSETLAGVTYTVEWLGDTVWNIKPAGKNVPIYTPARLAIYGVTADNIPPLPK